jgi:hypothetical protein
MGSKEFLIHDGALYVRGGGYEPSFSPLGTPMDKSYSVYMRPATLDEVREYQELRRSNEEKSNWTD